MGRQNEWKKFKYQYTNPEFLKFLVNMLGEEDVEASVFLRAKEMKEFKEEGEKFRRMSNETLEKNLEIYKEFLSRVSSRGIIFEWNLVFNYEHRQFNEPEIKYTGRNFRPVVSGEPQITLTDPSNFIGEKWEGVNLSYFQGKESIRKLKKAVLNFTNNGYDLIDVYASLNPQPYTSDHYFDGVDYDGHLFATDGVLEISGKLPEDFDFSKFIPKKFPGRRKMLEQLIREE